MDGVSVRVAAVCVMGGCVGVGLGGRERLLKPSPSSALGRARGPSPRRRGPSPPRLGHRARSARCRPRCRRSSQPIEKLAVSKRVGDFLNNSKLF